MKELKDTVEGMLSSDYKERFKAEYEQLYIRAGKLSNMMNKWKEGKLEFKPTCPKSVFVIQLRVMNEYLHILRRRAHIENIDLSSIETAKIPDNTETSSEETPKSE